NRQGYPGQAEFAEDHPAEIQELPAHLLGIKGEKDLVLPARDMPPYFFQRTRSTPANDRHARRCQRQVGINGEQGGKRKESSVEQSLAREKTQTFCSVNNDAKSW